MLLCFVLSVSTLILFIFFDTKMVQSLDMPLTTSTEKNIQNYMQLKCTVGVTCTSSCSSEKIIPSVTDKLIP